MSLYFYARSAAGLPLVQFLGFYQALEYYFAACFSAEAGRRVRSLLKDPTFRFDRNMDIMRILETVQGGSATGHVTERSMLRSTVQECVDQTELMRYLTED